MKDTIGIVVSRLRNRIKSVKQDSFVTDRMLYYYAMNHAKWIARREDASKKLLSMRNQMQVLKLVELEEVDTASNECNCIISGVTIKRSPLPSFIDGYLGPLIGFVTSLDRSTRVYETNSETYQKMRNQSNFKYNNNLYYWIEENYIYFPAIEWDAVRIEGFFDQDISKWRCDINKECLPMQQLQFPLPDYLLAEVEANAWKDLTGMIQIPSDPMVDNRGIQE